MESRTLPSLKAFASEPAARWLETHATIPPGTRLLTTFNYGSYLKWRLPQLSESIDSRGVSRTRRPSRRAIDGWTSQCRPVEIG